MARLGVNVDHVATVREARGTSYPDPVRAALLAVKGGADQITIHLREDRRHIKDGDLKRMIAEVHQPVNLEMAMSKEIVSIACKMKPATATIVPEKRQELTTEGGLSVTGNIERLKEVVARLSSSGIRVSMFIDPDTREIDASIDVGANAVELHTGRYCDAADGITCATELELLVRAARYAKKNGIAVAAGHGLHYENTPAVVRTIPEFWEYNIGHAIVARAIFVGIEEAVREMKKILRRV